MRNRYKVKKGKLFYLSFILLFFASFYITVGFSTFFSQVLLDETELTIRIDKDVRITNVSVSGIENGAITNAEEYNIENIYLDLDLPNSNSVAKYKISVKNYGNIELGISSISINNPNLKITTKDYVVGDLIRDNYDSCTRGNCKLNIDKDFDIYISYKDGAYHSGMVTNFPNVVLDFSFDELYQVDYRGFEDDLSNNQKYICKGSTLSQYIGKGLDTSNILVFRGNTIVNDYTYNSTTGYITVNNCQSNIDFIYKEKEVEIFDETKTLQEAIDDLYNRGITEGTIVLGNTVQNTNQININIPAGMNVTIDLNGNTLTSSSGTAISISGAGNVTFISTKNADKDISSSGGGISLTNNYTGTVTFEGLSIDTAGETGTAITNSSRSGKIIIKDCIVNSIGTGGAAQFLGAGATAVPAIVNTSSGTIDVINSNVTGTHFAVRNTGSGLVTIDGGTYTSLVTKYGGFVLFGDLIIGQSTSHVVESSTANKMSIKSGTFITNGTYANNYKASGTTCSGTDDNYICTK